MIGICEDKEDIAEHVEEVLLIELVRNLGR